VSTVNYYITQLKKSDLIKITKIGKFKRMYDFNHKIEINLTPNQEKIFRLIKEKPGLSQKDIIKYSNYSQSTTSRIIDELNTKKFLLYEIKNKKTVYFLNTLKDFRKE